jgi:hypothetical protein
MNGLKRPREDGADERPSKRHAPSQPIAYPTRVSHYPWRAFLTPDGVRRVAKEVPLHTHDTRVLCRGRNIETLTRPQLLFMAWVLGITNPVGFDISDCRYLRCSFSVGFEIFVNGWGQSPKKELVIFIWNRFEELDLIDHI